MNFKTKLIALVALCWLGITICLRIQAGLDDASQIICMDGGSGCAQLIFNPKFALLGQHLHVWGIRYFFVLAIISLAAGALTLRKPVEVLRILIRIAAGIGLLAALASGYAQYMLIHEICLLCSTLDIILVLIALVAFLGPLKPEEGVNFDRVPVDLFVVYLFGLAVFAVMAFMIKPNKAPKLPKVAIVNGDVIYEQQLKGEAAPLTYEEDLRIYTVQKKILEGMIDDFLLQQAAKKSHLPLPEYLEQHQLQDSPESPEKTKMRADFLSTLRKEAKINLLLAKPEPQVIEFIPTGAIVEGDLSAPVRILVFSDFECPYCRIISPLLSDLSQKHPKEICMIYCQFPLGFHQMAGPAARAGLCAQKQGKYTAFHDILFASKELKQESIRMAAEKAGLDMKKFDEDLASPEITSSVENSFHSYQELGIHGVPSVYFNGKRWNMNGAPSADNIEKAYREALEGASSKTKNQPVKNK